MQHNHSLIIVLGTMILVLILMMIIIIILRTIINTSILNNNIVLNYSNAVILLVIQGGNSRNKAGTHSPHKYVIVWGELSQIFKTTISKLSLMIIRMGRSQDPVILKCHMDPWPTKNIKSGPDPESQSCSCESCKCYRLYVVT